MASDPERSGDPETDRPWRRALPWLLAAAAALVAAAFHARYPYSNDDTTHYLIARSVTDRPWKLIDFWGRPAFTALHALPAQFGFFACRLTSVAITIAAAVVTWMTARRCGLSRAWLVIPLLILQPQLFMLGFSVLTETPGALIVGLALWAWASERWVLASLAFSAVPLARPEGFFIGVFVGFWFVGFAIRDRRDWRAVVRWGWIALLLGSTTLVWNTLGWIHKGDPLFLWTSNIYASGGPGVYGYGRWLDYLVRQPFIVGPISWVLLGIGLLRGFRRGGPMRFVASLWLFFFLLQTVLWAKGLFRTAGYSRFFVMIGPAAALLCLDGALAILDRLDARGAIAAIAAWLVVSTAALGGLVDWQHGNAGEYGAFDRTFAYYQEYVKQHGKPPQLLCNYHHLDFRLDVPYRTSWYPGIDKQTLDDAPVGAIVIWIYPYERQLTKIEPDYFYTDAELNRPDVLERKAKNWNWIHLIHETRPEWRELADFSRVRSEDDPWPFIQKVFLRVK